MGSLFSPKMPPLPPVQPLPEPPKSEMSAEDKERIAAEQAAIERRRRGRKSTILLEQVYQTLLMKMLKRKLY